MIFPHLSERQQQEHFLQHFRPHEQQCRRLVNHMKKIRSMPIRPMLAPTVGSRTAHFGGVSYGTNENASLTFSKRVTVSDLM
jgi:hypothetical protein